MLFILPRLLTLPFEGCVPLSLENTPQSQLQASPLFPGQAISSRAVSSASTRQIYPLSPRDYPVCVVWGSSCDSRLFTSALAMRYHRVWQSSTDEQNEYNADVLYRCIVHWTPLIQDVVDRVPQIPYFVQMQVPSAIARFYVLNCGVLLFLFGVNSANNPNK